MTDWFERLAGFREDGYAATQQQLSIDGDELVSSVNGKRYGVGEFSLPTLAELRGRVNPVRGQRTSVGALIGDARRLHADPQFAGALFQVASQFNVLEMTSERVTPEHGVTRYAHDYTQGPACALAAGAATIYRNYFVAVGDQIGQTAERQIDALAGLGTALSELTGLPESRLWSMRNGYALCTGQGLQAVGRLLDEATEDLRDTLRGKLAIGLHRNVEATDVDADERRLVSQAFCAALPLGYSSVARAQWEPLARLILEASYEATLLAAVEVESDTVLLTRIGGGVFANADAWIDDAIERGLGVVADAGLDVRIVGHRDVAPGVAAIIERWG